MNKYSPTTYELKNKSKHELQAIFRNAVQVAGSSEVTQEERSAAERTVVNVRESLGRLSGP